MDQLVVVHLQHVTDVFTYLSFPSIPQGSNLVVQDNCYPAPLLPCSFNSFPCVFEIQTYHPLMNLGCSLCCSVRLGPSLSYLYLLVLVFQLSLILLPFLVLVHPDPVRPLLVPSQYLRVCYSGGFLTFKLYLCCWVLWHQCQYTFLGCVHCHHLIMVCVQGVQGLLCFFHYLVAWWWWFLSRKFWGGLCPLFSHPGVHLLMLSSLKQVSVKFVLLIPVNFFFTSVSCVLHRSTAVASAS